MELRLHDAAAVRARRGADDVSRVTVGRRSRKTRSSWTSAAARQSSCSAARAASLPHEPRARLRANDRTFGDDFEACAAHVALGAPRPRAASARIGVAGTVTSLAALDLGLVEYDAERVHGHVLSREAVEEQLERLAALPVEERRRVPGLEPERAPVIVAGAVIVREVLARYGLGCARGERARHPPRRSARGRRVARARKRACSAWRLHLLLMRYGPRRVQRRLVLESSERRPLAEPPEAAGWEALLLWDHLAWVWDGPAADPGSRSAPSPSAPSASCSAPASHPFRAAPAGARAPGGDARRAVGGRAILGAGLGGNRKEFEEFGESFDTERRWKLLEEGLALIRELWAGPLGPREIPIWIGGNSRVRAASPPATTAGSPTRLARGDAMVPTPSATRRRRGRRHGLLEAGQHDLHEAYAQAGTTWWLASLHDRRGSSVRREVLARGARAEAGPEPPPGQLRRLVLRETALEDAAREDADSLPSSTTGTRSRSSSSSRWNASSTGRSASTVKRGCSAMSPRESPRVAPGSDDLTDERRPRHHPDEPAAIVGHEHRTDVRLGEPFSGLGCGRRGRQRRGLRHHRLAHETSRKEPPRLERRRHLADPADEGGALAASAAQSESSQTRSKAVAIFSSSRDRISSRSQKKRPMSCTHSKYETVTPPAFVRMSGSTWMPRSARISSASGDVGPFAPSARSCAWIRGAFSAVS